MLNLSCASAILFVSLSAAAQSASVASQPAAADQAPAPAPAAAAFDGNTPLGEIVANPAAKAVLDKDLPGVSTHPALDQVKGKSLRDLLPVAQPLITDEKIAAFDADMKKAK